MPVAVLADPGDTLEGRPEPPPQEPNNNAPPINAKAPLKNRTLPDIFLRLDFPIFILKGTIYRIMVKTHRVKLMAKNLTIQSF